MAEQLVRPGMEAAVSGIRRRPDNPFTITHAKERLAAVTAHIAAGEYVGDYDLRALLPEQARSTRITTTFLRGIINLSAAFGRLKPDAKVLGAKEQELADAAKEVGLLDTFGVHTFSERPERMSEFVQLYTGVQIIHSPAALFPDELLAGALKDGSLAIAKVWRDEQRRATWEAFYGIEGTPANTIFHSSDPATGVTLQRNIEQLARALYGNPEDVAPEVWLVMPPADTMR